MRKRSRWGAGLAGSVLLAVAAVGGAQVEVEKTGGAAVEKFSFSYWEDEEAEPGAGRALSFAVGKRGYALRRRSDGKAVCRDVYYVKTFGGAMPRVAVHVINSRFVLYPETLRDSEIPDTLFHDMMAVTRIHDLESGRLLHTSEPYRYDHNVPLKYDLGEVLLLGKE